MMKISFERNLLILADTEDAVGLGHIKRTSVTGEYFKKIFNSKIFVSGSNFFKSSDFIKKQGFIIADFIYEKNDDRYWIEIESFIDKNNIGIVIIDSYKFPESIYDKISEIEYVTSIVIDDFNRLNYYACDFLINYNPNASLLNYKVSHNTEKMFGLEYFFLGSNFINKFDNRRLNDLINIRRIAITMGGSDPENITGKILEILSSADIFAEKVIIIGPGFKNSNLLRDKYRLSADFTFFENPDDIAEIFNRCDIVISSCGITAYELLYLNVPFICISIAPDQDNNLKYFTENEITILSCTKNEINAPGFSDNLVSALNDLEKINYIRKKIRSIFSEYRGLENILKKVIYKARIKQLRFENPLCYSSANQVKEENSLASSNEEEHKKLRWGSREGMYNRFHLTADLLKKYKIQTLLDLGCGTGAFFDILRKKNHPGILVGLDLSMDILNFRKKNNDVYYISGTGAELPFKSESFDFVTILGMIQNCGLTFDAILKQLSIVLKKNGFLFFCTKNLGWEKFLSGELQPDIGHNWFTESDLEFDIKKNDYEIIEKNGFIPGENKIVEPFQSHEIYYLIKKIS